jgi:hypothetical protein
MMDISSGVIIGVKAAAGFISVILKKETSLGIRFIIYSVMTILISFLLSGYAFPKPGIERLNEGYHQ